MLSDSVDSSTDPFTIRPTPEGLEVCDRSGDVKKITGRKHEAAYGGLRKVFQRDDIDDPVGVASGEIPASVCENAAARVWIIAAAADRTRDFMTVDSISRGVARMSRGEVWYWSAKIRSDKSPTADKALRKMLDS